MRWSKMSKNIIFRLVQKKGVKIEKCGWILPSGLLSNLLSYSVYRLCVQEIGAERG